MALLDGILGGVVGAEMTSLVAAAIERHGGLPGLVSQFEQQGLGGVVHSWIGTGPPPPISADQLRQVLGSGAVTQMAANFGLPPQARRQNLTQGRPQAVDNRTPTGVGPQA